MSIIRSIKKKYFIIYLFDVLKLDLRGVRPPPRHCLRGRMTFSQQTKKTPEPCPTHPYTGARRLVS